MSVHADRPAVLIYRKQLLLWSETFIAAQAHALERYRPVFTGLRYRAEGRAYMRDAASETLAQHARLPKLSKLLFLEGQVVPRRWLRALAAHRPALLHAHFGWESVNARAIARALGIPFVVTFHGMDITVDRGTRKERRQRATAFRDARRIIAVSEFIAARLIEAGAPRERLIVHHIGVDTALFAPGDEPRADDEVLFVGRLVEKKGLIHLLRAMARMRETWPAAKLTVVGDGPLREPLEREAAALRLDVTWLGVQKPDRVRALMRRATVLCAPSIVGADGNAEGLPMSIVEAQASGLPVVAFPSGGSAEGVLEGETGFVVPPADEAALADRLLALLTDAERRARFARAARAWALREFDLQAQTRRLETIYDEARAGDATAGRTRAGDARADR
ncbi:MAG TPA: glycosyltransferase [Longimicrobiales bacterium]